MFDFDPLSSVGYLDRFDLTVAFLRYEREKSAENLLAFYHAYFAWQDRGKK